MKPNDIVQPTKLAVSQMKRSFMPFHRGVALSYPDQFGCTWVKWDHKKAKYMMASRFIEEVVKLDKEPD